MADRLGPIAVLRGALQATKANGMPDWPTRMSAVRMLAALRPDELEPEQPAATVVYDLPPGSAPVLHQCQRGTKSRAGQTATRAAALPEPGLYLLVHGGELIWLVSHPPIEEGTPPHVLHTIEDATQILRAFGGDPACLDTPADNTVPDAEPRPDTS